MTNSLPILEFKASAKGSYTQVSSIFSENTGIESHRCINVSYAASTPLKVGKFTAEKASLSLSTAFSVLCSVDGV